MWLGQNYFCVSILIDLGRADLDSLDLVAETASEYMRLQGKACIVGIPGNSECGSRMDLYRHIFLLTLFIGHKYY